MAKTVNDALNANFSEPIRDALWGHVYLTPEIEALTRSAEFMRLYRIAQLGPAALCYPGAAHTRAAHSIGVCHLTRRLLINLAGRGAESWLSFEGVRSMLCAALLHDAGHFPYAHSLKELPLEDHEALGAKLILSDSLKSLVAKTGADPYLAAAIIDGKIAHEGSSELLFYRKLLSGSLDPDKLDYLNRDARFCGVPYGVQDIDYIISILYPHKTYGVEIDLQGIASIESLLFSKYMMYRSVYWHHSVRSATAMIKKALFAGLNSSVIAPQDLYGLDDAGLFALFSSGAHDFFSLGEDVRQGRLYSRVFETTFDEALHSKIEGIDARSDREERIAYDLSRKTGTAIKAKDIIIDVPERASFEADFRVCGNNSGFDETSSIFTGAAAKLFAQKLRIVRLYTANSIKEIAKNAFTLLPPV